MSANAITTLKIDSAELLCTLSFSLITNWRGQLRKIKVFSYDQTTKIYSMKDRNAAVKLFNEIHAKAPHFTQMGNHLFNTSYVEAAFVAKNWLGTEKNEITVCYSKANGHIYKNYSYGNPL